MATAETILDLCDRWGKLPSEVLAEDMHQVMRLLKIVAAGRRPEPET